METRQQFKTDIILTEDDIKQAIKEFLVRKSSLTYNQQEDANIEFYTEMSSPDTFGKVTATVTTIEYTNVQL